MSTTNIIGNCHLLLTSISGELDAYRNRLCLEKKSFIEFSHFTIDPEYWRRREVLDRMLARERKYNDEAMKKGLCLVSIDENEEFWRQKMGEVMASHTRELHQKLMDAGILTQEFFDECKRRNINESDELIVEFNDAHSAKVAWRRLNYGYLDMYLYENGEMTTKWD